MKKKFKVKVVHYSEKNYEVYYTNHYLIPWWRSIDIIYSPYHPRHWTDLFGCTTTSRLFSHYDAVEFGKALTLDIIKEVNVKNKKKIKQWNIDEKEWYKKNIPFKTKRVK